MTSTLDPAIALIKEFHKAFEIIDPNAPSVSTPEKRLLRARLILEEFIEFLHAAGAKDAHSLIDKMMDQMEGLNGTKIDAEEEFTDTPDMTSMAHELGDITVVTLGAMTSFGVPPVVYDEIMASNMTKLDSNGKCLRRPDGKILKGPNYRKPNIASIINP